MNFGIGAPVTTTYTYEPAPDGDKPWWGTPTCSASYDTQDWIPAQRYLGFQTVTESTAGTGATHKFFTSRTAEELKMTGREKEVAVTGSLKKTVNTWSYSTVAMPGDPGSELSYFVFLDRKDETLADGTVVGTDYTYDCNSTPTSCYGLLTVVHNEGVTGGSDDTWVTTDYAKNVTGNSWLFVPSRETTRDAASGGNVLKQETYYYDGQGSYTATPSKGQRTAASTLVNAASSETTNVYTQYDSNGAVYRQSIATSQAPSADSAIPAGLPYTQTTYDSVFHTFPVVVTNPLGQQTTYTSDLIHSAQSASLPDASKIAVAVEEPNKRKTYTQYDQFGRPVNIWDDGYDSRDYPTKSYTYLWSSFPNKIIATERTQHGVGVTRATATCLDGFGREIERRSSYHAASGPSYSSSVTEYNSRGLKAAVANPVDDPSHTLNCTNASTATGNRTTYAYDVLNNVTITSFVGGTTTPYTEAVYNGLTTTLSDELRNQTTRVQDLAQTRLTVTDPAGSTIYQHDRVGNLIGVTDAGSNITSITYDLAGRKTSMNDPDMDRWSYTYDPAGKLKTQTDARGQTTALTYDNLARLTRKTYSDGEPSVAFTYDSYPDTSFCTQQADTAMGRMTRMTDGAGQQLSCFNTRGEELGTRRTIDGATYDIGRSFFATGATSDVTYPGGEHVAYSLNGEDGTIAGMSSIGGETMLTNVVNKPWGATVHLRWGAANQLRTRTEMRPTPGIASRASRLGVCRT